MIKQEFNFLSTLRNFNPTTASKVEEFLKSGKAAQLALDDLINTANQCFIELNFASAGAIYASGFDRFQTNGKYLYYFGFFLYECQFHEQSQEFLRKSIEVEPEGDPRKYFTLAEMFLSQEALDLYLKGLKLAEAEGQNLVAQVETLNNGATLNTINEGNDAGNGAGASGNDSEVKKSKIRTKLQNIQRTIAQAYCAVGELLMNHPNFPKNLNDVVHALKKAEEHDNQYYEFIFQRAILYFNLQDEANCRAQIALFVQKIRELEASEDDEALYDYSATMLVSLVRMMIEGAIYKDGAFIASIACSNDASNPEAFYMLAFCSLMNEEYEASKDALTRLNTFDLSKDEELKVGFEELCLEFKEKSKMSLNLEKIQETPAGEEEDWEDLEEDVVDPELMQEDL